MASSKFVFLVVVVSCVMLTVYPRIMPISSNLKTVLVTGGNRGIGLAIAEAFAKNIQNFQVIITSREKSKADEAAAKLEEKYPAAKGRFFGFGADIGDYSTVTALKEYIQSKFGSLDILINNAGTLSWADLDVKDTEVTVKVNVLGTINITEQLLPLINQNGKIISLGSSAGSWGKFAKTNKTITDKLMDEKNTVQDLEDLANEFINDVKNGTYEGKWVTQRSGYCFSKLMVNIYNRNLALRPEIKEKSIQVNAVCPGWTKTDMGGKDGEKSPEEGADSVVWLAYQPFELNKEQQGQFIRDRQVVDWEVSPYKHDE